MTGPEHYQAADRLLATVSADVMTIPTTPTPAPRIRWAPASAGVITGYVGTLEAFRIAPTGEGEKWAWSVESFLPGQQDWSGWAMTPEQVKATAAEWLDKYQSARPYVAAALAALRSEIEQERAACYDNAVDLSDEGKDDQRAFTKVDVLDWVLATMDRMEAGR